MYLLYLDGSASFNLCFRTAIYHLISEVDQYVESLGIGSDEEIELHASVMVAGRKAPWKGSTRSKRLEFIEGSLDILKNAHWG